MVDQGWAWLSASDLLKLWEAESGQSLMVWGKGPVSTSPSSAPIPPSGLP